MSDAAGGGQGVDSIWSGADDHAAFNPSARGAVYPPRLLASNGSLSTATISGLSDPRMQATVHAIAHDLATDIAAAHGPSSAHGTETEITIHIGRIDVTAVRAPAAKPAQAMAASAAAMSLDAYLSRRQRSGT
jgi:hypothetical protein